MQHRYPSYYEKFTCIAAACPDSCCQGWDVVIDSDTEAFYNSIKGEFGDRLRDMIYTDPDGDRVFHLVGEKKCPFWGGDKLCDVYKVLGKEHLCTTCAAFPRLTMDYTTFAEHTLALACPEAARLILQEDRAYDGFDCEDIETCEDYDIAVMRYLMHTRREAASILTAPKPLALRLDELLGFAERVQRELTGESTSFDAKRLPGLYADLEYIDEGSRVMIVDAARRSTDLSVHERELTNLALYELYRYYLGAIDSLDVTAPVCFAVSAVRVVAALAEERGIVAAAQLYSKEIEQSYENMEALESFIMGVG